MLNISGDLERLRRYWMTGTCKPEKEIQKSSDPLALEQFLSAFLLLMMGILLAAAFLVLEHLYFKYVRQHLVRSDGGGCCALFSLVSYFLRNPFYPGCIDQDKLLTLFNAHSIFKCETLSTRSRPMLVSVWDLHSYSALSNAINRLYKMQMKWRIKLRRLPTSCTIRYDFNYKYTIENNLNCFA